MHRGVGGRSLWRCELTDFYEEGCCVPHLIRLILALYLLRWVVRYFFLFKSIWFFRHVLVCARVSEIHLGLQNPDDFHAKSELRTQSSVHASASLPLLSRVWFDVINQCCNVSTPWHLSISKISKNKNRSKLLDSAASAHRCTTMINHKQIHSAVAVRAQHDRWAYGADRQFLRIKIDR